MMKMPESISLAFYNLGVVVSDLMAAAAAAIECCCTPSLAIAENLPTDEELIRIQALALGASPRLVALSRRKGKTGKKNMHRLEKYIEEVTARVTNGGADYVRE